MLDYTDYRFWNKDRCPYFTGIPEHGNRLMLELTEDFEELLEVYVNATLNIFEDGFICSMMNDYNPRIEEYQETIIEDLTNNMRITNIIEGILQDAPIENCSSIAEIVDYLKKGNF